MANPDSKTVEIEFAVGVWTDVSQWVDWSAGGSTKFGRSSPFSPPSVGTLTLTLANEDGRFSPHRQVLADGVTAHPYWPNVLPRRRIRLAYVIAGTPYYRFIGYIKGWPTTMPNNAARVVINATTRDDRLSRVTLLSPIRQAISSDGPVLWWPLDDEAGSAQAAQAQAASGIYPLGVVVGGPALVFGDNGPGVGDGTGVKFAPASATSGQYLSGQLSTPLNLSAYSVEVWVNAGTSAPAWAMNILEIPGRLKLSYDTTNGVVLAASGSSASGVFITDGKWHHILAARSAAGGTMTLYVDGVAVATDGTSLGTTLFGGTLTVGEAAAGNGRWQGNIGQVAIYQSNLSGHAGSLAGHVAETTGFAGDTTDQRIARFLGAGGLSFGDWVLDVGKAVVGTYPQAGKDVISACQDMAITEGGGSVFYFGADGKAQFRNRSYRNVGAPTLTLSNEADLEGETFSPAFDDTQIVNQVQGSRATSSDTASTQIATDAASVTAYGLTTDSITSYAQSDGDVLANIQDRVAQQRQPAYRLGQVAVDLVTAQSAGLYAAVAATGINDRIRVTTLPATAAPVSSVDVLTEGWADTFDADNYTVAFDTSPADNPPRGKWDSFRWQCDGQTLDTTITNAGTTVIADTLAGLPTFTTAAVYPLSIDIGEEIIQLNTAPGGAVSPQTFTGVTRGTNSTPPAQQTAGVPIALSPATAWQL